MAVLLLPTLASGGINVLVGKILGDPWGSYLARRVVGKVTATLTGVIPAAELLLLIPS